MRPVKMNDVNAFLFAILEARAECSRLTQMCEDVTAASSLPRLRDPNGAQGKPVKSMAEIRDERDRVLQQFERAVYNFLGVRRVIGETQQEFCDRIFAMSQDEIMAVRAKAHRSV